MQVNPVVLAIVAAISGYVGQFILKAPQKVKDEWAAAILVGSGLVIFGVYALGTPIPAGGLRDWSLVGLLFVLGPAGIASLAGMLPNVRLVPSTVIVPASALTTPDSTMISVDLPAPFSPISACTSPAAMPMLTPLSARTPP